ncbi:MAG: hypothetical protein IJI53_07490 [Clostridia bacterium]|nr:hypothetical protein [Clostridia bacterium]
MDIEFDELSDEVKHAYLFYHQLYWLQTFENARTSFGLTYTYYLLPDSDTESDIYIIDGTVPSRADHIQLMAEYPDEYPARFNHPQGDEAEYLYLGDQVPNARSDFGVKWSIWDSGEKQIGFQTWDNEYGKTYAYYTPVVINGQRMGMIGTEIDIESVNTAILNNTLRQFLIIGLIFVSGTLLLMWYFSRRYVRKVSDLEWQVRDFSKTKDVSVAGEIRKNIRGKDEISSLSEEVALMIEEIHTYIVTQEAMQEELEKKEQENEKLISVTEHDERTGLYNRSFFYEFANVFTGRIQTSRWIQS